MEKTVKYINPINILGPFAPQSQSHSAIITHIFSIFQDLELQKRQLTDMLQNHNTCCAKNKSSPSPTAPYAMLRPYDSPTSFPNTYDTSPYIRPESANILASSYSCITPLNTEASIDCSTLDAAYISPPLVDSLYQRPESVLANAEFHTTDGYLPKSTNILVIESTEPDYYEAEMSYNLNTQQCHTYPVTASEAQTKITNGLDGCLVQRYFQYFFAVGSKFRLNIVIINVFSLRVINFGILNR